MVSDDVFVYADLYDQDMMIVVVVVEVIVVVVMMKLKFSLPQNELKIPKFLDVPGWLCFSAMLYCLSLFLLFFFF